MAEKERVLCLVRLVARDQDDNLWDQDNWMDSDDSLMGKFKELLTPLIDHLHTDKENGQFEPHYHADTRYRRSDTSGLVRIYPHELGIYEFIAYRDVEKISEEWGAKTPTSFISKSKLKHKCIHKGKCPHRGFDLTNVKPDENGEIVCPLHSLRFDAKTKKLLTKFENT